MRITADYTNLMQQAPMTAQSYMIKAVKYIDEVFGSGYAKQHPDLVADFMKVSGQDFTVSCLVVAIQEASDRIGGALENVAEMIGRTTE